MAYPKDLTGLRFGKWNVLGYAGDYKWKCQCDCGNIRDISRNNLVSGDSTSCGCDSNKDKLKDLQGQKFGKLTVLEYNKDVKKWLCQCECGNTVYKRSWDLRYGKATTCGCIKGGSFKRQDLTNKKCGALTPIEYIGEHKWKCICDCGRTTIKTQTQLKNPNVSCGCQLNQNKREDLTGKTFGKLKVIKYLTYSKYLCECDCGNTREVSATDLINNKVTACKECTQNRLQEKYDNDRINLLGKKFGDLEVIGYEQSEHKWICKCSCGKEIKVYGQHLRVGDTRSCGCKYGLRNNKYRSYLECEIANYINSIYTGEVIHNHRGILDDNREIDIFIPELKLGIEINGTYWHNDDVVNYTYHQDKVKEAYNKGVRLIHIYENEWRNDQNKIEKYLNKIINNNINVVYARDTNIVIVDNSDAKKFLEENHLQGYVNSSVNIGLTYKNKLISLMTFGKPRFNSNYQYELIRLAFDNNIRILGGASKMLKYFTDTYKPLSIISYCNIDKFDGSVYSKLGFKILKLTQPNYLWINPKNDDILTRYQTQKHELVKNNPELEGLTEDKIMKDKGYYKIYNSGNLIFEWRQE